MTNTFQTTGGFTASAADIAAIEDACAYHGDDVNSPALTFVCVACGTIGYCAAASQRDMLVGHFDFTCCNDWDTFVALTRQV